MGAPTPTGPRPPSLMGARPHTPTGARHRYSAIHERYKVYMPALVQELPPSEFVEAIALAYGVERSDYQLGTCTPSRNHLARHVTTSRNHPAPGATPP